MKLCISSWIKYGLAIVLLITSLAYVLTHFDWPKIAISLQQADWPWLLVSGISSTLVYWWLRALRWDYLLKQLNISIPLSRLYWYIALSLSLAILTPMQSGEVLKIELLKRHGVLDRLPGYTLLFVERVADLMAITTLSLIAVLLGVIPVIPQYSLSAILISTTVLLGLFTGLLLLDSVRRAFLSVWSHLRTLLPDIRSYTTLLSLTLLGWIVTALGWQGAIRASGIELDLIRAIVLTASVTLINVLSVVPGAIGVSEFSVALLLKKWCFVDSAAQTGAIMLRMYGLLIVGIGLLHLIIYRVLNSQENLEFLISHHSKKNPN